MEDDDPQGQLLLPIDDFSAEKMEGELKAGYDAVIDKLRWVRVAAERGLRGSQVRLDQTKAVLLCDGFFILLIVILVA
ncbi:hypothetical protein M5K25_020950 [Dendrobium thyrsiflorum]|uniref:Uncharacterized protein n=1 Tax=Dendrobium thyrsiflorum TaxID=117978 RepID=A0ABD0UB65_DENTH